MSKLKPPETSGECARCGIIFDSTDVTVMVHRVDKPETEGQCGALIVA